MKVAEAASQVLHQFLKSVIQGVKYQKEFPNGIEDIASRLFELCINRSKIPPDEVRLHEICLDAETEDEEQYLKLKSALNNMLGTIIQKVPNLATDLLTRNVQEIVNT